MNENIPCERNKSIPLDTVPLVIFHQPALNTLATEPWKSRNNPQSSAAKIRNRDCCLSSRNCNTPPSLTLTR